MTDRPNLCIQIGLHKTGTTTLNTSFYLQHPEIEHLGKPYPTDDPVRRLLWEINLTPEADFDLDGARERFAHSIGKRLGGSKLITINESSLSHGVGIERSTIARRLFDVCGPTRILVVLRRQDELLRSIYFQAIGTKKTKLSFADWLDEGWVYSRPAPYSQLDYSRLVNPFADVFGRESVGVFLYEDFQADAGAFAHALSEFMGVDAAISARLLTTKPRNPRMTKLHTIVRRHAWLDRCAKWLRRSAPAPVVAALRWMAARTGRADAVFDPAMAKRLAGYIGESNAQLAENFGLPLAARGYPMADDQVR